MNSANTTLDALQRAIKRWGNDTFIEDNGRYISYRDTDQMAQTVASHLLARGVKPGDSIALWCPNRYEWIIALFATHYCGAVLVPLNTRFKGREAEQILQACRAKVLFCIGHFLGRDYPAQLDREQLPDLQTIVGIGEPSRAEDLSWSDCLQLSSADELEFPNIGADSVSDIIFTSGTTGKPKGVITCHGQNMQTFTSWANMVGLDHSDRYLIINPFFHSFGYKAGILACLASGARILPEPVFDVTHILQRIARDRVTMLPGPPTIFQSMLAHPELDSFDLSSLCKSTTGAAVIPTQLIRDMREKLGIETVLTAYGLSETCGLATMCRRGDADDVIAQTSGRAIPGIEVAIGRADGGLCEPGESGEILVRGFNVMREYLDNVEATKEAIDNQQWLHTGDIGNLDSNGNLRITDRLKDMYISGGFNCYPAEIESTINSHPDITMCAVIGVADERMGEVGAVYYVSPSDAISPDDLKSWCRANLANYKVPKFYFNCQQLPLTASGKVQKPEIRDQWQQHVAISRGK